MEGFGSVKKFHSLTKDSSERESREKREEGETEDLRVGFDKRMSCPEYKTHLTCLNTDEVIRYISYLERGDWL